MKRFALLLIVVSSVVFAQEEKDLTKMERFVSNTGQIIKLENFNLPPLTAYNEKLQAKIRKATISGESAFFLVLTKEDKYGNKSAAIAEEDLTEVLMAFENIMAQIAGEDSNADYLENKFTTDDGFQIGYAKGKSITWFITLERYGKSTVLFNNPNEIKVTLVSAISKIEELKQLTDQE